MKDNIGFESTPLPHHDQIAARAYHLFLERGRLNGHDLDDWLQAEYELLQLPLRKIAELDPPPLPKGRSAKKSLVNLVRAAMF